jgi:hypothetical protein
MPELLAYRPSSANIETTARPCDMLIGAKQNTIIIGDINMQTDWNGLKTDVKGRQLLKTMEEEGFKWWPAP